MSHFSRVTTASLFCAAALLSAAPVQGQGSLETTVQYANHYENGIPGATPDPAFPDAAPATISFEVDNTVSDSQPDPNEGRYFGAVLSLIVEIPSIGLTADFSNGNVSVFDNTSNPDDQIAILATTNNNGTSVSGELLTQLELDFTGTTELLSSDAIIESVPPNITHVMVIFRTATGRTNVHFGPPGCDSDGDGYCDWNDNCPNDPNPDQADHELDGRGNACDPDCSLNADGSYHCFTVRDCSAAPMHESSAPLWLLLGLVGLAIRRIRAR